MITVLGQKGEQMPRLIETGALMKRINCYPQIKETVAKVLRYVPTADAVEVVRCKDCIHYFADGCDECRLMIAKSITASIMDKRWYSDFFCAWGERKEDE